MRVLHACADGAAEAKEMLLLLPRSWSAGGFARVPIAGRWGAAPQIGAARKSCCKNSP